MLGNLHRLLLCAALLAAACTRTPSGPEHRPDQRGRPAVLGPGQLVIGATPLSLSMPPAPVKGARFTDPLYRLPVARVTDRRVDGYQDPGIKHEYARSDPENADGTRLVLRGTRGNWYLYDARSFRLLKRLPLGRGGQEPEPRWDHKNPRLLYHLSGMKLMTLEVERGSQEVVQDFTADFPEGSFIVTGGEGDASLDRDKFCFIVKRVVGSDWQPIAVFVYGRQQRRILGQLSQLPGSLNWVSMDMSGRHCVIGWDEGAAVHSLDLKLLRRMPRGARGHADLALTSSGSDVLVYQDVKTDWIRMTELSTGHSTDLLQIPFQENTDIGLHFSGNAAATPGWVLVSTYGAKNPPRGRRHSWMDRQIFMLELDEDPRIWRIAAARSFTFIDPHQGKKAYFAEPYAAINTRGSRIYWGSNWGQDDLQKTELFVAQLPEDWSSQLLGPR